MGVGCCGVGKDFRHDRVDFLMVGGLTQDVLLSRLGYLLGVRGVNRRNRAAVMLYAALSEVDLEAADLRIHAANLVSRPLEDVFLAVLQRPIANLGIPVVRVAIHSGHGVALEDFIDSGMNLATGNVAAPLCRIPYSRAIVWTIARRETEAVYRLGL
jgi:hypothetical protein